MFVIELEIIVEDIAQIALLYDRLLVFRSPDKNGDPTPFSLITASEPTQAILDGTIEGPWSLNGKSLIAVVDEADPVTISFTGTNPFNLATVSGIINSAFQTLSSPLASEVPTNTGKLRLRSPTTSTRSIIQIDGTAALTFGLSTERINGKNASPLLSANTEIYRVIDFDGQPSFWYKARYLNSETGALSDFSPPFLGVGATGLPSSALSTGKIALSDAMGRPLTNRRIIFVPTFSQIVADGNGNNYGVLPSVDRVVAVTDGNGRALVSLVKGQRVKVFIEGTSFQREFTVPSLDFDVMTVASTQPDPLSIVTAPPFSVRVS